LRILKRRIKIMDKDYSGYYNKGNDCDTCENQYLCGAFGDATGCKLFDEGRECEFVEHKE
jgi:hypothetical protein